MQEIKITLPENLINDIKLIKDELKKLNSQHTPKAENEYLTRQEVANLLKINLSSLWSWTNKGILVRYQIAGRVYYKKKEVENALKKVKQIK